MAPLNDSPGTIATSLGPATKIISACKESNELSLEAWVTADSAQPGPTAPIITVSQDEERRNFMLAQTGVAWDIRVRMADTDEAGNPGTSAPTVSTEVAHIVYTLDNTGQVYIFTDGVERGVVRPGDLSSWDSGYELTLGNDTTLDSPWAGTVHLAAIYCVALTTDEVDANFRSGF